MESSVITQVHKEDVAPKTGEGGRAGCVVAVWDTDHCVCVRRKPVTAEAARPFMRSLPSPPVDLSYRSVMYRGSLM